MVKQHEQAAAQLSGRREEVVSLNLPRERITWHPIINYDACIGDRECVSFCQNDVFV